MNNYLKYLTLIITKKSDSLLLFSIFQFLAISVTESVY